MIEKEEKDLTEFIEKFSDLENYIGKYKEEKF
jgi:hypothetical protein